MKLYAIVVGIGLLHCAIGFDNPERPECISKCWDNSKYVSTCTEAIGTQCLCEDAEFQNVVLQCLYSQCQTTQFGSALHHALSECSNPETDTPDILPPLIRHQGLRKRGSQLTASVSAPGQFRLVSASAKVAAHSVARRSVLASAFIRYSARPIRSVAYPVPPSATPSPLTTSFTALSSASPNSTIVQVPTRTA